jgi:hypothetical protein
MFKALFEVGMVVCAVIYLIYVLSAAEPCERAYRAAAPVRISADVVRWTLSNWATNDKKLMLISWSYQSDMWTRGFVLRQFYGKDYIGECHVQN